MKTSPLFLLTACAALFAGTGCSHIEITQEGNPNRTVNGTVEFRSDLALPDDAVVVVRVVDPAGTEQMRTAAINDLPLGDRARPEPVPQVLGEQTITGAKGGTIPFHIDYIAEDSLLRHGLNIDARISFAGKVRFHTAVAHVLTLGNAEYPHAVWLELAAR
jgi:uncharacterized lipoprotein YbaY